MPARWGGAREAGGARGAAGGAAGAGAVCAALVTGAPLAPTPSTDRSTLPDERERATADRTAQTEPCALYPPLAPPSPPTPRDALPLGARHLTARGGALPPFSPAHARARLPAALAHVTALGAEIPL